MVETKLQSYAACFQLLTLPLTSCVTLAKVIYLSVPQLPIVLSTEMKVNRFVREGGCGCINPYKV